MDWSKIISENIQILVNAPIAVVVLYLIFRVFRGYEAILNNLTQVLEKMLDKLK